MRRRRLSDLPVPEAAADMVRRYGRGAAKRARDREDAAETEATAGFYQRVGEEIYRLELERAERKD